MHQRMSLNLLLSMLAVSVLVGDDNANGTTKVNNSSFCMLLAWRFGRSSYASDKESRGLKRSFSDIKWDCSRN